VVAGRSDQSDTPNSWGFSGRRIPGTELIRSSCERVDGYFFNPAVQFNTTVMGEVLAAASSITVLIKNLPSGATS
jgi:hypothetical protein